MKHQNILAADGKKLYAKPQINVVEIKSADIICTSSQETFGIREGEGFTTTRPW